MTMDSNTVARFAELMNSWDGDTETACGTELLAMVHPDYRLYDNGSRALSGRAGFCERIRKLWEDDPSFRQDVEHSVQQGDIFVLRWVARSDSHPEFRGMTWAEFRDDMLFEVHQFWTQPQLEEKLLASG